MTTENKEKLKLNSLDDLIEVSNRLNSKSDLRNQLPKAITELTPKFIESVRTNQKDWAKDTLQPHIKLLYALSAFDLNIPNKPNISLYTNSNYASAVESISENPESKEKIFSLITTFMDYIGTSQENNALFTKATDILRKAYINHLKLMDKYDHTWIITHIDCSPCLENGDKGELIKYLNNATNILDIELRKSGAYRTEQRLFRHNDLSVKEDVFFMAASYVRAVNITLGEITGIINSSVRYRSRAGQDIPYQILGIGHGSKKEDASASITAPQSYNPSKTFVNLQKRTGTNP